MRRPDTLSRHLRAHLLVALLWLPFTVPAVSDPYRAGVEDFRHGDYRQALAHFLQARSEGRDSPALRYNLAATYYRLGRYAQARRLFEGLRDSQPVLAPYNLGLIARAQGEVDAAVDLFREAYAAAEPDSRLHALAAEALHRLDAREASPRGLEGGVELAVGYDDNVAFEPADRRAGGGDALLEGYLWAAHEQPLTDRDRLRFRGGLYSVGYAELGRYDLTDLSTSATWMHRASTRWQWSLAGEGALLWQRGRRALDTAGLQAAGEWSLAPAWRLSAGYEGRQYRAGDTYDYLDGSRHEVRVALSRDTEPVWWRLRYARRRDNRADFSDGERFFSYSPRSHRVSAAAGGAIAASWAWSAQGRWHALRYAAADRYTVNGEPVQRRREDRYLGLDLELRRRFGRHWHLFAEFRHGDNDSNIDANDYRRNVILAGIGWRSR